MLLDDSLGMPPHVHTFICNAKSIPTEWLVADLALASHCVPIITLSSALLLQAAVESHPPDAIIVQVTFLQQLLEVLEESQHTTTVIVTGDRTGESKKHGRNMSTKIVTWEDVETFSAGPVPSTPPSELITLPPVHELTGPKVAGDISSAHFYSNENGVCVSPRT